LLLVRSAGIQRGCNRIDIGVTQRVQPPTEILVDQVHATGRCLEKRRQKPVPPGACGIKKIPAPSSSCRVKQWGKVMQIAVSIRSTSVPNQFCLSLPPLCRGKYPIRNSPPGPPPEKVKPR